MNENKKSTATGLMKRCVQNLVGFDYTAFKKTAMISGIIRDVNDVILRGMEEELDKEGIVAMAILEFDKIITRRKTFHWKKPEDGSNRNDYLLEWMNDYVEHVFAKASGSPSTIRTYLDDTIPKLFDGIANVEHVKQNKKRREENN